MKGYHSLKENDLIKETGKTSPETVVLVGNGALENGWLPLRKVLDQWIHCDSFSHDLVKKLRTENTEALHQLASLSYKFKLARGLIYQQWSSQEMSPLQTEKAGLGSAIQEYLQIRQDVGNQYRKSSSDLSLKFDQKIKQTIGNDAVFITTNWDNALWLDKEVKKAIYLHGRCDHPDSLVFPTELVIEDIAYECPKLLEILKECSPEFCQTMLKTFRCSSVDALLGAHSAAARHIHQAQRLIIWGYSLGDYDADINAIIGTNINRQETRELIVINTDPYAFQRGVALTGLTSAWHYNPYLNSMLKLDV